MVFWELTSSRSSAFASNHDTPFRSFCISFGLRLRLSPGTRRGFTRKSRFELVNEAVIARPIITIMADAIVEVPRLCFSHITVLNRAVHM